MVSVPTINVRSSPAETKVISVRLLASNTSRIRCQETTAGRFSALRVLQERRTANAIPNSFDRTEYRLGPTLSANTYGVATNRRKRSGDRVASSFNQLSPAFDWRQTQQDTPRRPGEFLRTEVTNMAVLIPFRA